LKALARVWDEKECQDGPSERLPTQLSSVTSPISEVMPNDSASVADDRSEIARGASSSVRLKALARVWDEKECQDGPSERLPTQCRRPQYADASVADDRSEIARGASSSVAPPSMPVDDGTYIFKFRTPSGRTCSPSTLGSGWKKGSDASLPATISRSNS
jgi:hypothetical protein